MDTAVSVYNQININQANILVRNQRMSMNRSEPIRLAGIIEDSVVDGPGVRFAVFVQGCPHDCEGCHNPYTQDFNGGFDADIYKIADKIISSNIKRLTFTGGEPFCKARELVKLAKLAETEIRGTEIITYSGYLYEELLEIAETDKDIKELLTVTNYLIDGKFDITKKTSGKLFRGSSNQRIFDITCYPNSTKARLIERLEDF
ncbi:MAG: anaerobic ribonucleoside-triphosphate reductase activating protein [Oscillospiraceae bacterium]|nr:anaerobic ribonucleoside-triphosphate reductase activating protein [Oscillospiraceae bacterium]